MEVTKIVLTGQDKLTSDEKDLQMLQAIEKQLKTGPIIGEAREALLFMSRNLQVRDMILHTLNITPERCEALFRDVNELMEKRDAEILAERNKG